MIIQLSRDELMQLQTLRNDLERAIERLSPPLDERLPRFLDKAEVAWADLCSALRDIIDGKETPVG